MLWSWNLHCMKLSKRWNNFTRNLFHTVFGRSEKWEIFSVHELLRPRLEKKSLNALLVWWYVVDSVENVRCCGSRFTVTPPTGFYQSLQCIDYAFVKLLIVEIALWCYALNVSQRWTELWYSFCVHHSLKYIWIKDNRLFILTIEALLHYCN